ILSSKICRILCGRTPEGITYELFLDENGEKNSKSRGNGLAVEEWLAYAPPESLTLVLYNSPRKAKRLHVDVIPRCVDDYLGHLEKFAAENEPAKLLQNPAFHVHGGTPPRPETHLTYSVLLNLASVCNTEDKAVLWGFITRYDAQATPESAPILDGLIGTAIAYYRDFVKPGKTYRTPDEMESAALEDLARTLAALPAGADFEAIQTQVYEVGKRHEFEDLRAWFKALYEILLGQSQGPRMGSFMALYGLPETLALIARALNGENLAEPADTAA
ncbi:MAG: lysine--tRNA ligase, partial [Alphaproteobacteria bacterium]